MTSIEKKDDDEEFPDLSVFMLLHPDGKEVLGALRYDVERDWGIGVRSLHPVGLVEEDGKWGIVPHGCYDDDSDELHRAVMETVQRNGWGRIIKGVRYDSFRRFGVLERSSAKAEALECLRQVQEEGRWARLGDLVDLLFLRFSLARDAMVILRSDADLRRLKGMLLLADDGLDPEVVRLLKGGGGKAGGASSVAGGSSSSSSSFFTSSFAAFNPQSDRFPPPVFSVLHTYPQFSSSYSTPETCADLLEFMARFHKGVAEALRDWEARCLFQGFKAGADDYGVYRSEDGDDREEEGGEGEEDEEELGDGEDEEEEDVDDKGKRKRKRAKGGKNRGPKPMSRKQFILKRCMEHVESVNGLVAQLLRQVRVDRFVIPELARILVRVAEDRAVISVVDGACGGGGGGGASSSSFPRSRRVFVPVYRCSFRWAFMCALTERAQRLSGGRVPSFKDVYEAYVAEENEAGRRGQVTASDIARAMGVKKPFRGGWRGYGGYSDPMGVLLDGPCERRVPKDRFAGWKYYPENVISLPQGKKKTTDGNGER